jgi:hypothetical protein
MSPQAAMLAGRVRKGSPEAHAARFVRTRAAAAAHMIWRY